MKMNLMSAKRWRGFTLVELVMVIVLLGIIAGILAPVITQNVKAYQDTAQRNELLSKGRIAMARLSRILHQSVPYSLELVGTNTIEFVSSSVGGRYVDWADSTIALTHCGNNRRFRLTSNRSSLCLLHEADAPVFNAGDILIIGNSSAAMLRIAATPASRVAITSVTPPSPATSPLRQVGFVSHKFLSASQGKHYMIADHIHEIGLNGTAIYWRRTDATTANFAAEYDDGIDVATTDPMLIDGVSGLTFEYLPSADGMLRITLSLAEGDESITLYEEVYVRNAP